MYSPLDCARMEAQNITILFDHIYDTRMLLECLCDYAYICVIHRIIEYISQLSLVSIFAVDIIPFFFIWNNHGP